MDNLQIPSIQINGNFNWDDIRVGDSNLDHSQNFFAKKHLKHERLPEDVELDLINEMVANSSLCESDKEVKEVKEEQLQFHEEENKENVKESLASPKPSQESKEEKSTKKLDETVQPTTKPLNIACEWSTQKPVASRNMLAAAGKKGTFAKPSTAAAPSAYQYNQLYQRKKEEALKKRLEEERKMRQFHSRPLPNFQAHHEHLEKRKVAHFATVPLTPKVLKHSRETEEKRRKKLEEYNREHNKPPRFEARSTKVLTDEPFKPKKAPPKPVELRPFNLHSDKRLHERKHFDEAVQKALEEKHKQEEEERKKREEEYRKELRKMATFKARPNPFK